MKEICTLLVKLHIIFSRMQRVNQHARPSIIQVGRPTCCYQVCALDHANGGAADLDYQSEHSHRNVLLPNQISGDSSGAEMHKSPSTWIVVTDILQVVADLSLY